MQLSELAKALSLNIPYMIDDEHFGLVTDEDYKPITVDMLTEIKKCLQGIVDYFYNSKVRLQQGAVIFCKESDRFEYLVLCWNRAEFCFTLTRLHSPLDGFYDNNERLVESPLFGEVLVVWNKELIDYRERDCELVGVLGKNKKVLLEIAMSKSSIEYVDGLLSGTA